MAFLCITWTFITCTILTDCCTASICNKEKKMSEFGVKGHTHAHLKNCYMRKECTILEKEKDIGSSTLQVIFTHFSKFLQN